MKPTSYLTDEAADKYQGEFVALPSFMDDATEEDVIAHGKDATKVIKEARKKGIESPFIIAVPPKGLKKRLLSV